LKRSFLLCICAGTLEEGCRGGAGKRAWLQLPAPIPLEYAKLMVKCNVTNANCAGITLVFGKFMSCVASTADVRNQSYSYVIEGMEEELCLEVGGALAQLDIRYGELA
jgi:hypothetical protein